MILSIPESTKHHSDHASMLGNCGEQHLYHPGDTVLYLFGYKYNSIHDVFLGPHMINHG